jgi:uncharacterized protein (TIGR02145 family)
MAGNLAWLPSVSPSSEGSVTAAAYYVNGYEGTSIGDAKTSTHYTAYGVLYNWEAAKTACPAGWHLPGDQEWKAFEIYLGMTQTDADSISWRLSGSVGEKLKSTAGWAENGNGSNSVGFNALPGGYRDGSSGFLLLGTSAVFWSATGDGPANAWDRYLANNKSGVDRGSYERNDGYSMRCLRD